jgi:hypothetical protein
MKYTDTVNIVPKCAVVVAHPQCLSYPFSLKLGPEHPPPPPHQTLSLGLFPVSQPATHAANNGILSYSQV